MAQESLEHRDVLHDRARRERPAAGAGRSGFLPGAKRADGVVNPASRVHPRFIAGRGDAGNRPDARAERGDAKQWNRVPDTFRVFITLLRVLVCLTMNDDDIDGTRTAA
ncbi:hypothetical protein LGM46_07840 [Burkholderia arboris]|uniref:hypothetical protein n=1 Tax=Burkholderia arboris TaxID=488730 RepID=UPI001CF3F8A0|nr:hypothetical protein [Burkholderia arboris]MCA8032892.1 hypothetical protein [Burkholderia arboris]